MKPSILRTTIPCAATASALLATTLPSSPAPATANDTPASRPNILFLFSDDHALSTISAYARTIYNGRVMAETPNIDRIANEGALFTRSFCTNSICVPSRATILTGNFAHKNGTYGLASHWNGRQTIFPRLMRNAGYQTALIGKWHLNPDPTDEFQYWKVLSGNGGQGDYYNPTFRAIDRLGEFQQLGTSSDIIANDSIEWLNQRDPTQPFLLMTQFKAPHVHRMPAPRHLTRYANHTFPLPPTFDDNYAGDRSPYIAQTYMRLTGMSEDELNIFPADDAKIAPDSLIGRSLARLTVRQRLDYHAAYAARNAEYYRLKQQGKLKGQALDHYKYQRYMQDYMSCVAEVDDNVGRLLQWLDDNNLAQNTIVIYASDQGFFNGEHGWTDKRMMYEESFRMPFIIRWPAKIKPAQNIDALIQNIDYAPTFLDIAGLPIPPTMQGRSLLPLFTSPLPPPDWRTSLYYHYYDDGDYNLPRIEGVRNDRYKLIRYYIPNQREDWDLMDLEKDPLETRSFYRDPTYADIVKQMHAELAALRRQYEVPDAEPTRREVRSAHSTP